MVVGSLQNLHGDGLAGAVRAEQHHHLTALNPQIHTIQHHIVAIGIRSPSTTVGDLSDEVSSENEPALVLRMRVNVAVLLQDELGLHDQGRVSLW